MMFILWYVILGFWLVIIFVILVGVVIKKYEKHCEKQLNNVQDIFVGKISDNQKQDQNQAMKYLKLTNSIKSKKP